jgi:hypothetical protein
MEYESELHEGDMVEFLGVGPLWFTNVIENGKKLPVGGQFVVKTVRAYSSWTAVTLEETGDLIYNSTWFKVL